MVKTTKQLFHQLCIINVFSNYSSAVNHRNVFLSYSVVVHVQCSRLCWFLRLCYTRDVHVYYYVASTCTCTVDATVMHILQVECHRIPTHR